MQTLTDSCIPPVEDWPDAPPRTIPGDTVREEARALAAEIAASDVTLADVVRDATPDGHERGAYTYAQTLLRGVPGVPTSAARVGLLRRSFSRLTGTAAPSAARPDAPETKPDEVSHV